MRRFGKRESEILDALYRIKEGSVADVLEALERETSYEAVRTTLRVLEGKGAIAHRVLDRRFIYRPTLADNQAWRQTARRLADVFFGGSIERAAIAMLKGSDAALSKDELRRLEERVAEFGSRGTGEEETKMIDSAVWLLRWTLAGAALGALVSAFAYALEKRGRAVSLAAFRAALIAALAAPVLALAPPIFTVSAPGTMQAESGGLAPRFIDDRDLEPAGGPTADAQQLEPSASASGVADALAAAFVALWIAGAAFAAISRQRSYSRLSQAFRNGAPFSTSFVECRLSADAAGPLLFGVLRPLMLAPSDFGDWTEAEREAVLSHEAAHARRGDLVWAFIGDIVRIAYWWAPPVRPLVSQHMRVTEEACDAVSFARSGDRHDYARALLSVARRVGGHRSPGLAMTAAGLSRRVERLISEDDTGATFGLPVIGAGAAAALMLVLSAPAAAGANPFRMYIFAAAGGPTSIYALSDGERATAAAVETCVGRLLPNAAAIVDEIEGRIKNGRDDELNPVWIVGPGSRIELGSCREKELHDEDSDEDADEDSDEDSLVVITDASEKQARKFIRQIDALSLPQQQEMAAELGLD